MKKDTYLRGLMSEEERADSGRIYNKLFSEIVNLQYDINADIRDIRQKLSVEFSCIDYDINRDIADIYQKIQDTGLIGMAEENWNE